MHLRQEERNNKQGKHCVGRAAHSHSRGGFGGIVVGGALRHQQYVGNMAVASLHSKHVPCGEGENGFSP